VKEGDYFSAGGWSGKIKRISHESGNSTHTNRTFAEGRVPVGETGWGVRLANLINYFVFLFFYNPISLLLVFFVSVLLLYLTLSPF
jgi:hypothetical protein